MTPLQVIMLTHQMRQAQKAYLSAAKGETPLMGRHSVMVELEKVVRWLNRGKRYD